MINLQYSNEQQSQQSITQIIQNYSSFYAQDNHDQFANKYLNQTTNYYSLQMKKQHILQEVQNINHSLRILFPNRPTLGDLFSPQLVQVQKTVQIIKLLLNQRHKDMEAKNQIFGNTKKIQGQKSYLQVQIQKYQRQLKKIQNQRDVLNLKIKTIQKAQKQVLQKHIQQKQQYLKKYKAIQARQNQYKIQYRKQETTIKNLQDKINRGQQKVTFKNNIEVLQQFQKYGPTFIMMNGQNEYNQMVAKTMQQNYLQIVKQNQYYKDCLNQMQKQLKTVLDLKKQILKKRKHYQYEQYFQIKQIKPELFNLPMQFGREGVKNLQQNVERFKQGMKIGQMLDQKQSDQKINCVNNVKNLIKNYKNVVQSQQQLLNKVLVKAKQFKNNQIQAIQSRFNKNLDQDELQRARRFLQQQSSYLDNKNRQLQITRKAMQSTIRKVQQQREQYSKKTTKNNEQLINLKRNIESLPILVEREINK